MRPRRLNRSRALLAAAGLALWLGCEPGFEALRAPGAPTDVARPAEFAVSAPVAPEVQPPERYLIRRARVTLEVKDVDTAAARVREIAEEVGGRVEAFEHSAATRAVRHNVLTLRVPEPRLDEALERVQALGKVENLAGSELEATEQVVDLDIRLRNLRRLEERLLRLLENRTAKLEEVLAAERELARVREEIERHEGQRRQIEREAAWSRLDVELHEPYPVIARPAGGIGARLGRAVLQAGDNLVTTIAVAIASLGVVLPLAAVAALLLWGLRWARRRGLLRRGG